MSIFFTSDFHFGHENIIKYCYRPFENAAEMDAAIVAAWNAQVGKDDVVYFLGDFCFKGRQVAADYTAKLNGTIEWIYGNHDPEFSKKSTPLHNHQRDLQLKNGMLVKLCHFPYMEDRYPAYKPKPSGEAALLHGHKHCKYLKMVKKNFPVMIDVGIDNTYKLYSEDDIIALLEDPRDMIPSRITQLYFPF